VRSAKQAADETAAELKRKKDEEDRKRVERQKVEERVLRITAPVAPWLVAQGLLDVDKKEWDASLEKYSSSRALLQGLVLPSVIKDHLPKDEIDALAEPILRGDVDFNEYVKWAAEMDAHRAEVDAFEEAEKIRLAEEERIKQKAKEWDDMVLGGLGFQLP